MRIAVRIRINFSESTSVVPFDNQKFLNGLTHRWLGKKNGFHDDFSEYSVSPLRGGFRDGDGLSFKKGYIIISSICEKFIDTIEKGIQKDIDESKEFNFGMYPISMSQIVDNIYNTNFFFTHSPILLHDIKLKISGSNKFYTTKGQIEFTKTGEKKEVPIDVNKILYNKTRKKLLRLNPNIDLTGFNIFFTKEAIKNSKVKRIKIGKEETVNYASAGSVIILGNSEVKNLLYYTGVGDSCGSGFGTLVTKLIHDK